MTATQADVIDVFIGGTHDGDPVPSFAYGPPLVRMIVKDERRLSRAIVAKTEPSDSAVAVEDYVWRSFVGNPWIYRALVWANFVGDAGEKYVLRELIDRGLARGIDPANAAPTPWRKRDRRPHILRSSIKCERLEDGRFRWTVTACDQWGQEITTKTSVENFREIRDEFDATVAAFKAAELQLEHDRRQLHSQRAEK